MSFYTEKNEIHRLHKPKRKQIISITRDSLPGILPRFDDGPAPMAHHQTSTGKRIAFYISTKRKNLLKHLKVLKLFSIMRKASFTVESAFILPLFLLSCLAIFSMLDFHRIYIEESMKLRETAKKTAMLSYLPEAAGGLEKLYPDGYLTLSKLVTYQIPYSPFPLPKLQVPCHARVHIWCGYLGSENGSNNNDTGTEMVYVTDYESVYHTSSSCSHLDLHIYTETLSAAKKTTNIDGARYQPCEKCIGKGICHEYVYLSERGTAFHNSLECSGLKRSIHLVSKEQVADLGICSRCQANSQKEGA